MSKTDCLEIKEALNYSNAMYVANNNVILILSVINSIIIETEAINDYSCL